MTAKHPAALTPGDQRGIALVIVLWIVAALSLLVAAFNASLRTTLRVEVAETVTARRTALSWAGVEIAALRMIDADEFNRWRPGPAGQSVELDGATLQITIADHGGRVDLNLADEKVLRGLFGQIAGDERLAAVLADRVLDWRDIDRDRRENGGERGDYVAGQLPWGPADGDFLSRAMLHRLLGVDATLASKLMPLITVYSRDGKINPGTAPRQVLAAIPGMTAEIAQQLSSIDAESLATALAGSLQHMKKYLDATPGPAYSVAVTVLEPGVGAVQTLDAVIVLVAVGGRPYRLVGYEMRPAERR